MRAQSILSLLAAASAASAQSQSAPVVANNPVGAQYLATLPEQTKYTVRGSVQIQTAPDGKGVDVSVALSGLPAEGGPFMYHIHEKPVPADGNCTGTGAHLDPYKRGETPACDATKPETCQTGDLSGKHGNATAQSLSAKYTDLYLATLTTDPSYFGNLSVVVHLSNKTRISCANFTIKSPGAVSSVPVSVAPSSGFAVPTGTGGYNGTLSATYVPTGTGSGTSNAGQGTGSPIAPSATSTPPPTQSNNPAQKLTAGAGAMLGVAVAMML